MAWLQSMIRSLAVAGALLMSVSASAEIYRWVDAAGRMNFTQDIGQIPLRYRAASKAEAEAPKGKSSVQHYTPVAPPARIESARGRKSKNPIGKSHRIRVRRAGASMMVKVRVNGELDVPFIIDTGATDVVLPMWAALELGLAVEGPTVRTSPRRTANGLIQAPVVMLDSVQLGTARVENVGGLALKGMTQGLLGLSFFNNFTYNIDAAQGIVTLTENRLAEEGVLRGGRGKGQWRGEFAAANIEIERAQSVIDAVPFGRSRERAAATKRRELLVEKLRLLELEADDARVPFSWRD